MSSPLLRPDVSVVNDLSCDQRLLLETVTAVSTGAWSDEKYKYAKVAGATMARWLTLATRILMFYIRTDNPSEELCRIVNFIQKVYAPGWLSIKTQNNFLEGPRILYKILENTRQGRGKQIVTGP